MNIREHIEAGHYPDKLDGYTVVPLRNGKVALIVATNYANPDFPGWPILGIMPHKRERDPECWREDGSFHNAVPGSCSPLDLAPPPPRKMVDKRYLATNKDGSIDDWVYATRTPDSLLSYVCGDRARIVEFVREYEEPWA